MITDWKGNEVKEGDEICIIRRIRRPFFTNVSWLIPDGMGKFQEIKGSDPEPAKECWEVGDYTKVEPGFMCTTKEGDTTYKCHISLLTMFMTDDFVLAIKGLSDVNPNEK